MAWNDDDHHQDHEYDSDDDDDDDDGEEFQTGLCHTKKGPKWPAQWRPNDM